MTKEQKMVKRFREKSGLYIAKSPGCPNSKIIEAVLQDVGEEVRELCESALKKDLLGTADGICDALAAIYGVALVFGLDMEPLFREVYRFKYIEHGPPGLAPIVVAPIIENQKAWFDWESIRPEGIRREK